jgi:hypothetical protein
MASMTKLRRRLLRWERYVRHYPYSPSFKTPPGHDRAVFAVDDERERWTAYWPEGGCSCGLDWRQQCSA